MASRRKSGRDGKLPPPRSTHSKYTKFDIRALPNDPSSQTPRVAKEARTKRRSPPSPFDAPTLRASPPPPSILDADSDSNDSNSDENTSLQQSSSSSVAVSVRSADAESSSSSAAHSSSSASASDSSDSDTSAPSSDRVLSSEDKPLTFETRDDEDTLTKVDAPLVVPSTGRARNVIVALDTENDSAWMAQFEDLTRDFFRKGNVQLQIVNSSDSQMLRDRQDLFTQYQRLPTKLVVSTLVQGFVYVTLIGITAGYSSKMPNFSMAYHYWLPTYSNMYRLSSGAIGNLNLAWLLIFSHGWSFLRCVMEGWFCRDAFLNDASIKRTRPWIWIDYAVTLPLTIGTVAIAIGLLDFVVWLLMLSLILTTVCVYYAAERTNTADDRRLIAHGAIFPFTAAWVYLVLEYSLSTQTKNSPVWILMLLSFTLALLNSLIALLTYQNKPPIDGKQIGPLILSPLRKFGWITDALDTQAERYMRAILYIDCCTLMLRTFVTLMVVFNLAL